MKGTFKMKWGEWDNERRRTIQVDRETPYVEEIHILGEILVIHHVPNHPNTWKVSHKDTGLSVVPYTSSTVSKARQEAVNKIQGVGITAFKDRIAALRIRLKQEMEGQSL